MIHVEKQAYKYHPGEGQDACVEEKLFLHVELSSSVMQALSLTSAP